MINRYIFEHILSIFYHPIFQKGWQYFKTNLSIKLRQFQRVEYQYNLFCNFSLKFWSLVDKKIHNTAKVLSYPTLVLIYFSDGKLLDDNKNVHVVCRLIKFHDN
jgi:hypothetical protein